VTNQLALTNVITISVAAVGVGINAYNTSNLALFTSETPDPVFSSGYKIYLEPTEVGDDFGTTTTTYAMANAVFSQQPNILAGGGSLIVIPLTSSETLDHAITRAKALVQFFGVMSTEIESDADTQAAAAVIQALNKVGFFVQRSAATLVATTGILSKITEGGYTQSRPLYYGTDTDKKAVTMQAAYAGRALSVNFSGSNTTQTMNLKSLTGVVADPTLTQTQQDLATIAGADTYPSLQGVAKVLCSGANSFFDQVYNLQWIVGALGVAGFNYLAQTATKLPQTEAGMDGLKGAYRAVLKQGVTNQYMAPGTWNSATTFGVQQDLYDNIAQTGFYLYSAPIASQLQVDRAARKAPLVQIALKEAGALQSSSVIINVNA